MINIDDKIIDWVAPYDVDFLYKYRSINNSLGLKEIFTKNELYFPNPNQFNDPFDCLPRLTVYKNNSKINNFFKSIIAANHSNFNRQQLKKEAKKYNRKAIFHDSKWLEETYKNFNKDFGIYSLSEIRDDILMWSHYSDSHTGICLEFNSSGKDNIFREALKVRYQDDYPTVNVMNFSDFKNFFNAFLVKSNHWKYEKERRIIREPPQGPGKIIFPSELLTGVILGSSISSPDKKLIIGLVEKYVTPIKLYKAVLNKRKYALDIVEIK